jgi:GT2 family glycosyltransferase
MAGRDDTSPAGMDTPSFSLIVPTRDRREQLHRCLEALSRLDYPRERVQVIVVDDGGAVAPVVPPQQPWSDEVEVLVVRQRHAGPAAARNTGAAAARGRFLAFTDDDCQPSPHWLRAFANRFAADPDRLLGGRTVNALPQNPYSAASQLIVDIVYSHYNADPCEASFVASNNMAVSSELFRELGGFDPRYTTSEDRDLCDRWLARRFGIALVGNALVHHAKPLSLTSFCHQHFRYGRGAYHFHRGRIERDSGQLQGTLAFYRRLPERARLLVPSTSGRFVLALLALWQAANAAGFAWEAAREAARRSAGRMRYGNSAERSAASSTGWGQATAWRRMPRRR